MQGYSMNYLISAHELITRLNNIALRQRRQTDEVPLNISITGLHMALTADNFHLSETGTLVIQLPPARQRVKHYNVYVFGKRMDLVAADDFDNLRRQLCAAEQRIERLKAMAKPKPCGSDPYI